MFVSDNKSQYFYCQGRNIPLPDYLQAEVDRHDPNQEKIVELLDKTRGARINRNPLAMFPKWVILRYGTLGE